LLLQLDRLAETPSFSQSLDSYIEDLRRIIRELISKISAVPPTLNEEMARLALENIWQLTQFLTGSTTKQVPYEVVHAIERAATEWTSTNLLVTTAIVQESSFFFEGGQESFFKLVEAELGITIHSRPVQIALPYIYRHKPLFCIPLFHELGHYVDTARDIVVTTLLQFPADECSELPGIVRSSGALEDRFWSKVVQAHRHEYFADLFSASYVGDAARGFLEQFCPAMEVTPSHPASADRFALLDDFLNGRSNPIIDMFQQTLAARGLPKLEKKFDSVDVATAMGDVRPFTVYSDRALFGLFEAGWRFLMYQWDKPTGDWVSMTLDERVDITNDLIEKSIRNRMIMEAWDATADAQ
jgi:hypothetical protein